MTLVAAVPLMIVDDDSDAHFFLGRTLAACGIANPLISLESGEAAVRHFEQCLAGKQTWPAMVFLDIKMPAMNGFGVLTWLREHDALGKTVVAMMTTSDMPRDVSEAFRLGAHTYLNKGVKPAVLGPLVQSALRLTSKTALER